MIEGESVKLNKMCECNYSSIRFFTDAIGRMDIDVSLVEDCRRLAKQCKMADVIEELENKCKHVYEFGTAVCMVHRHTDHFCIFT